MKTSSELRISDRELQALVVVESALSQGQCKGFCMALPMSCIIGFSRDLTGWDDLFRCDGGYSDPTREAHPLRQLFFPDTDSADAIRTRDQKWAARTLGHLLETGIVDWDRTHLETV
jgi:hypothetical protein